MHSTTRRIVGATIAAAVASSLLLGAPSAGARPRRPDRPGHHRPLRPAGPHLRRRLPPEPVAHRTRRRGRPGSRGLGALAARASSATTVGSRPTPTSPAPCGVGDGDATAAGHHRAEAGRQERGSSRRHATGCSTSRPAPAAGSTAPASGPTPTRTGLVVQAMIAMGIDPATVARPDAPAWASSARCSWAARRRPPTAGALDYQKQSPLVRQQLRDGAGHPGLAGLVTARRTRTVRDHAARPRPARRRAPSQRRPRRPRATSVG